MKKTIIILTIILLFAGLLLSIFPGNGDYTAERLLYRAVKTAGKISANPDVVPPSTAAFVEKTLQKVMKDYPKSVAAKVAYAKLAEFYTLIKKYDKAMDVLDKIVSESKDSPVIVTQALFFKGNILEKEDRWNEALSVYKMLRDKYTNTPLGLQMPIYIANHYTRDGLESEAAVAYKEAVAFYAKIAKDNEGNVVGYWSSTFLLQSYLNLKDYEEAGRMVENIISRYPSANTYMQNLPLVEFIFIKNLKDNAKALEIYKKAAMTTKDPRLLKALKKKIGELEGSTK